MCLLTSGEVYVTGAPDERIKITSGVPQGDPLSPTIFNLFMDELLVKVDRHLGKRAEAASCYADDVTLIAKSREELQFALTVATNWASGMGMTWGVDKSSELISSDSPPTTKLLLAGKELPQKATVKYLGVSLDWTGVSTASTETRISKAAARLGRIRRSKSLRKLSYYQRRLVVLSHVLPLADHAIHLSPLPASTRASAALLERQACSWILDHPIPSHQTIRSRTLARIPPLTLRRQIIAYRRIHGCRISLLYDDPSSADARRARMMLDNPTLTLAGTDAPRPHENLKPVLARKLVTEWKRVMHGRRPVPTTTKIPPSYICGIPPLLHVISSFYLNTIDPWRWSQIPQHQQLQLRKFLSSETLNSRERKSLYTILSELSTCL